MFEYVYVFFIILSQEFSCVIKTHYTIVWTELFYGYDMVYGWGLTGNTLKNKNKTSSDKTHRKRASRALVSITSEGRNDAKSNAIAPSRIPIPPGLKIATNPTAQEKEKTPTETGSNVRLDVYCTD